MNTFGEYVTTPGRPAATRPASRTRAATATNRSRSGPEAANNTAASATSNAAPRSARANARRTCCTVGCSFIQVRLASRPVKGAAGPAHGQTEVGAASVSGARVTVPSGSTGGLRSRALGHQIFPPASRLIAPVGVA